MSKIKTPTEIINDLKSLGYDFCLLDNNKATSLQVMVKGKWVSPNNLIWAKIRTQLRDIGYTNMIGVKDVMISYAAGWRP